MFLGPISCYWGPLAPIRSQGFQNSTYEVKEFETVSDVSVFYFRFDYCSYLKTFEEVFMLIFYLEIL